MFIRREMIEDLFKQYKIADSLADIFGEKSEMTVEDFLRQLSKKVLQVVGVRESNPDLFEKYDNCFNACCRQFLDEPNTGGASSSNAVNPVQTVLLEFIDHQAAKVGRNQAEKIDFGLLGYSADFYEALPTAVKEILTGRLNEWATMRRPIAHVGFRSLENAINGADKLKTLQDLLEARAKSDTMIAGYAPFSELLSALNFYDKTQLLSWLLAKPQVVSGLSKLWFDQIFASLGDADVLNLSSKQTLLGCRVDPFVPWLQTLEDRRPATMLACLDSLFSSEVPVNFKSLCRHATSETTEDDWVSAILPWLPTWLAERRRFSLEGLAEAHLARPYLFSLNQLIAREEYSDTLLQDVREIISARLGPNQDTDTIDPLSSWDEALPSSASSVDRQVGEVFGQEAPVLAVPGSDWEIASTQEEESYVDAEVEIIRPMEIDFSVYYGLAPGVQLVCFLTPSDAECLNTTLEEKKEALGACGLRLKNLCLLADDLNHRLDEPSVAGEVACMGSSSGQSSVGSPSRVLSAFEGRLVGGVPSSAPSGSSMGSAFRPYVRDEVEDVRGRPQSR